jgi:hypothetical protein
MNTRTGQCLCGAVKFTAQDVETDFGVCHCIMCQRWSGGPFFSTTTGKVEFEGEEHITRYQSSVWAERGFCNICGSNIYYRIPKLGNYEMCVGAFDDTDGLVMTSEIFIDRKPDGFSLAGDHPRLTEKETLEKYSNFSE